MANSILTSVYYMMLHQCDYRELGADYFDRQAQQQLTRRLVKRLEKLGHKVTLQPAV